MKGSILFGMLMIFLLVMACPEAGENLAEGETGEALARRYCSNCHQFPAPTLLDRTTWQQEILPKMGYMMGMRQLYDSMAHHFTEEQLGTQLIDQTEIFPRETTISPEAWQKIRQFYLDQAPAQLDTAGRPPITSPLDIFSVRLPEERFSPPGTSLIQIMEGGKIMMGDIHQGLLLQYDRDLHLLKSAPVGTGAVHLNPTEEGLWLTVMGNFLASDQAEGYLVFYPRDKQLPPTRPVTGLKRPVHTALGDLNQDGQTDILICEFGKWNGQLSWWEAGGDGYRPHILSGPSAPMRAYIEDLNGDGRPDIIALFGQGREGIRAFYQEEAGQFREEELIALHPAMGSSFFNLRDVDGDGDLDILYTAGDNADYRPIRKPYQGIYLYLNENGSFRQEFFYPLYGAYRVAAEDFDQDGDLDLAAISFFPDYRNQPEASFVYLENQGDYQFSASTFQDAARERWISMDVGDLDADGDLDIVLGALAFEIPDAELQHFQEAWLRNGIPFLVLENQLDQAFPTTKLHN
ncbi:FG-GAP repeat domain-containing protein [Flavilitoribacter nigricans]|uniref:VCBS repeat-containing protein n=1 Tax=Flavilitoribacter nigricans (strain ATCC 23147 / DSM 23189 / NBRC 102662 / NCIMB 1420 / SS-2) TaxID=1122177 RepID=A0A2D0N0V4_FLAN2|nr:VCBS repeat-containing protein [Flavilitoribacter nigricans]PHN02125.1 hypothetical protein CRP01_33590 [Flavilitoribacter nigricans DSM 23189 = NBRC 102662]